MPRKTFVSGEILTASDVNTFLGDQAVMTFADDAARGSAIPSPSEGMVTYLSDVNRVEAYTGAAFVPVNTGFTRSTTFTVSNATQGDFVHTSGSTFTVPSLGFPIVRVTVIGGGGGGGSGGGGNGAAGGTTTFNAGGAGSVSAAGGFGGANGNNSTAGVAGQAGNSAGNFGRGAVRDAGSGNRQTGTEGGGGAISIAYLNLSGVSTVDVTIGAGGAGGTTNVDGGAGGRGEVIVEYVGA